MNYADLNPRPVELIIQGKTHELKPFSLESMVWLGDEFSEQAESIEDGLIRFQSIFRLEQGREAFEKALFKIAYYQLSDDDKKEISSIDQLKELISDDERDDVAKLNHITKCISDSIGNSQPQYDEAEERRKKEDLKKKMILNRSIGQTSMSELQEKLNTQSQNFTS